MRTVKMKTIAELKSDIADATLRIGKLQELRANEVDANKRAELQGELRMLRGKLRYSTDRLNALKLRYEEIGDDYPYRDPPSLVEIKMKSCQESLEKLQAGLADLPKDHLKDPEAAAIRAEIQNLRVRIRGYKKKLGIDMHDRSPGGKTERLQRLMAIVKREAIN